MRAERVRFDAIGRCDHVSYLRIRRRLRHVRVDHGSRCRNLHDGAAGERGVVTLPPVMLADITAFELPVTFEFAQKTFAPLTVTAVGVSWWHAMISQPAPFVHGAQPVEPSPVDGASIGGASVGDPSLDVPPSK